MPPLVLSRYFHTFHLDSACLATMHFHQHNTSMTHIRSPSGAYKYVENSYSRGVIAQPNTYRVRPAHRQILKYIHSGSFYRCWNIISTQPSGMEFASHSWIFCEFYPNTFPYCLREMHIPHTHSKCYGTAHWAVVSCFICICIFNILCCMSDFFFVGLFHITE